MPLAPYLDALSDGGVAAGLVVFFALLIAHGLCDHPLQGEFIALRKNRHYRPEDGTKETIWPYCLSVHALIHAGGVWVVTSMPALAFAEFFLHWIIDYLKTENVTNIHTDQLLHVLCKVGYVVYIAYA